VEIGIGVAYGELVAGCMGSEDRLNYTVLSDRVNLASRLCSVAERGEVLVDGSVAGALGDEFRAERREPVALKGFSEPVEVFALSFDRPARLDATKGRA
jgi:class 3 adenylate cyclase